MVLVGASGSKCFADDRLGRLDLSVP
jgi:hypothetical protein